MREHLPGNTAAKDEDNACEARAIRHARAPTLWQSWGNWQKRFDKIPQRIWKQRGGHASRYPADGAQDSEVLLRAFMAWIHRESATTVHLLPKQPIPFTDTRLSRLVPMRRRHN
jgi:hypothetical protein